MKSFFFIIILVLLLFSIFELNKDITDKKYKLLIVLTTILLVCITPLYSILCFFAIFLVSIFLLFTKKNKRLWKHMLLFFGIAFLVAAIIFTSITPSITKSDIDNMSDDEKMEYIYDADDDKGKKLYEEDKDIYKYLFKKYFDKDYDSVKIPNEKTIDKIKDSNELSPEQSTKLEIEKPKLYDKYLETVDTSFDEEIEKEQEDTEDTESDEDKLKDSIDSEITSGHGSIKSVDYYNDSLGKNAVIVIKGKENLSDKMTSEGMRYAVADTVKGVRDSRVSLDTFTIDVIYPVEDDTGNTNHDFHVIKSEWSMNTVKNMSRTDLELLNTDLDKYANSYDESTALK